MALIGYARVSTTEQDLAAQRSVLAAAGCAEIVEETASGADPARPELARLLARIRPGDTLVVARLDRLARSLAHLLAVIARLQARGAGFRSLADPIDTAGPSGTLILQILGAVAEFERALIRERTRAGLAAARAAGRRGGNPGLRARDPATIARLAEARARARLSRAIPAAEAWIGTVRRLRPVTPWPEVAQAVNAGLGPNARSFTPARLARLAGRFVQAGLLEPAVLMVPPEWEGGWEGHMRGGVGRGIQENTTRESGGSPRDRPEWEGDGGWEEKSRGVAREVEGGGKAGRPGANRGAPRAVELAAAYLRGRPDATLAELGTALLRLGVHPPRGSETWAPSSLKRLVDRGRALGLVPRRPAPAIPT